MEKAKILIVEDEVIVAEDLEMAITEIGYEVIGRACSEDEAIKKAIELKPDIILMDIVLKGKNNGIDASQKIKKMMDVPIIFLTAYSDIELINKAKSSEPHAYIVKPFQERQLLASIEMALYKNRMEKKLKENREWLSTTLKSIGDAVITTDTNGFITFMNPVAEVFTGYKQENAVGKPLDDVLKIMSEETGKQIDAPLGKVLKEGVVIGLDSHTVLVATDGTKLPIDDSGAPIKNDKGNIIGAVIVFHDITERRRAEKALKQSFEKLQKTFEGTINALSSVVEMRDPYTAGHQRRVTRLAYAIAKEMNLSKAKTEAIRIAGTLHDIGKIHIPAEILSNPSKLNEVEMNIVKTHSQVGYDILKTIESPWPVAKIVLQHHERMNGSGYPNRLVGQDILLEARIIGVADVVEAMASHRPYRSARGLDKTLEEISKNKGILYDSKVVDICLKLFKEKKYKLE